MRKPVPFLFVLILIAGLLLGGCAPASATPVELATEPASPTTVALATEPATESPAPTQPAAETGITLVDGTGNTITLEAPAQRAISLAPAITEILFAIGAGSQTAGRDMFSDYPSEAQAVADIGGGFGQLNTELIVSLNPDLVLASELTPPEQVKTLQDLGLLVFVLPNPVDLNGMYDSIVTIARLTGHEQEAGELVESLQQRVAAVEEKTAGVETRPTVFYELDGTDPNAPWTSGAGTFIDTMLTQAGGENLGNIMDSAWGQMSLEVLVAEEPDIILLGDAVWGGVTPEAVAARPGWEALSAVKSGQVYAFDDNLAARPGPRLVDGLEALAQILHPELFQ